MPQAFPDINLGSPSKHTALHMHLEQLWRSALALSSLMGPMPLYSAFTALHVVCRRVSQGWLQL